MPGMSNNYTVVSQEYGVTTIETMPCMLCKQPSTIKIPDEKFWRWHDGEDIQDVFSDWTPEQHELLISGTHDACWNELFKEQS